MKLVDWPVAVGALGALGTFMGGVWAARAGLARAWRALCGLSPFYRNEQRSKRIEAQVAEMLRQLRPDGGESLIDKVDKLTLGQAAQGSIQARMARTHWRVVGLVEVLLERASILAWESDVDGKQVWANSGLAALTGYTTAELAGWGWLVVIHHRDRTWVLEAWKEALEHGHRFKVTCRCQTKGGLIHEAVTLMATPVGDDDTVLMWIGTASVDPAAAPATAVAPPPPQPQRRRPHRAKPKAKPKGTPA
ncbi:MAG TPA: PAS domain-containing protein [Caulobacteraceae bacterium]|jgi:PAS domain S-box-containing protein